MLNDISCPYCDEEIKINHDDGYGYEEGKVFQQECRHCDMIFIYTTSMHFYYDANKAPCLNGEKHSWRDIQGYPPGYQSNRQHCEYCDKEECKNDKLKYDPQTDKWSEIIIQR